jgi:hypothetical protein
MSVSHDDLKRALRVMVNEGVSDWSRHVREDEGEGWEGPRARAFEGACITIERYLEEHGDPT